MSIHNFLLNGFTGWETRTAIYQALPRGVYFVFTQRPTHFLGLGTISTG